MPGGAASLVGRSSGHIHPQGAQAASDCRLISLGVGLGSALLARLPWLSLPLERWLLLAKGILRKGRECHCPLRASAGWLTCPGKGVRTGLLPAISKDPSPPGLSLSNTLEQYLG